MGKLKDKLLEYLSPTRSVAATDYTAVKGASSGVPVTAQWRDGKVSVGGVLVTPEKVVDGKAIVRKGDIDSAVSTLKNETGAQSGYDILKKYDKYKDMYDEQLDKLTDRKKFSYDPDSDVVFDAYKKQYNREGKRASEDTMGIYSALTGGMANSGAVTAAAQSRQYWSDKLTDVIPELAEDAYNRYLQEIENDRKVLADIMSVDKHLFEREYKVNEDTKADILTAQDNAQKRDTAVYDYNLERDKLAADQKAAADKLEYEKYRDDADRQTKLEQSRFENALDLFKATGEVSTDAIGAALGLPTGTVTAQIKSLFSQLAAETQNALDKFERDKALENLKNQHTLQQIYARK